MKLSIRFADQIVGAFIVLALGILVFAIFMLGSNQRWFSRDYHYITYFDSASGISQNMAVQYKGFHIGRVTSIELSKDNRVEVGFIIFDTYIDRVREGSLVEIVTSPIGTLGAQFLFHPGPDVGKDPLDEGSVIYSVNSPEGKRLIRDKLAVLPERDDSINRIITKVGDLLVTLDEAFKGTDDTSLGRTMMNVEGAADGLQQMAEKLPIGLENSLGRLMKQLEPIMVNLQEFSDMLANPDGSVAAILDSEGSVYTDLVKSLHSLSGVLRNLEETTDFIPEQLPRLAMMLAEVRSVLSTAEDVLVSLTNNPLLKRGIPERKEVNAGGVHARDIEF